MLRRKSMPIMRRAIRVTQVEAKINGAPCEAKGRMDARWISFSD
jgi:hypothetical protein